MDRELLDIIAGLLKEHCWDYGRGNELVEYSTGPVTANVKAIRRLVAEGRAEIITETTQRLTFRLVPLTECRHGVSLDHNCNGCSDSGDDPRTVAR